MAKNQQATANNLLLPGDFIFEKYKVIGPLTQGGMNSHIYTGENVTLNPNMLTDVSMSKVVIKVVKRLPEMKEHNWIKFIEEVVTASRVQHINLVQTYDVAQPYMDIRRNNSIIRLENVAVIVMESIDGPSLRSLLNSKGYFSVDESMYYFKKMVLGVRRLHTYSHMIIHRDLKPENILLSPDLRELKIVDFGISSSVIIRDVQFEALTDEQSLFGTVDYMSPDNLDEEINPKTGKKIRKTPTPQFDFHSLGIILFEMLTGEKPFIKNPKDDKGTIKKAKIYDMPVMHGIRYDIPNSIENIVFRCVASKREDLKYRYHNCDEILNDIQTYNLPERVNEPLIKPIGNRVLERPDSFNPKINKFQERFFYTKWLFILISSIVLIFAIVLIVLLILFFTS